MGMLLIPVWIYMAIMAWKRGKGIFGNQLEAGLARKYLKYMKMLLLIAGVACVLALVGIFMHNLHSAQYGEEELIFFLLGISGLYVFMFATEISLIIFLRGRKLI
jgi:hypothetical protein